MDNTLLYTSFLTPTRPDRQIHTRVVQTRSTLPDPGFSHPSTIDSRLSTLSLTLTPPHRYRYRYRFAPIYRAPHICQARDSMMYQFAHVCTKLQGEYCVVLLCFDFDPKGPTSWHAAVTARHRHSELYCYYLSEFGPHMIRFESRICLRC